MKRALRHISLILFLTLGCGGTLTAQAQISAEQTQAIGNQLLESEDYTLAIQYFNKAIKAKPYLCEPYYLRGLAKMMLGDYAGAESDCSYALELNKYKREPLRIRGISRLQLGKDSLALADFLQGLEQAPQERTFLYLKGITESRLNLTDKSDETFALLQRLYPRFTPAYTARARNFLSKGKVKDAINELDKALAQDKYSAEPCMLRAMIEVTRENWPTAEKFLDRAIAILPRRDDLYVNRGVARAATKKKTAAITDFISALEINPDNITAANNLAILRSGKPDYKLSLVTMPIERQDLAFLTTTGRQPDTDPLHQHEGAPMFALTFTHPYDNLQPVVYPEQELDNINSLHRLPSSLYLSKTAAETPDAEQAVALFAFAETPVTAHKLEYTRLLGRAVAYAMLKNYDDALADLNILISAMPDLSVALMERAFIRVSQASASKPSGGTTDSAEILAAEAFYKDMLSHALEDIDAAVAAKPESAYTWYNRGLINGLLADYAGAIRDYSQAILLNDAMSEAYLNRGLLHLKLGEKDAARTDLSRAGELGASQAYTIIKNL